MPPQIIKISLSLAARFALRPKRHCDSGSSALRLSFHHVAFRAESQCGYYQTALPFLLNNYKTLITSKFEIALFLAYFQQDSFYFRIREFQKHIIQFFS